ncbi:hypothetical protein BC830DRAFT_1152509 [Chytriomyces sp. MP71]|nr:hypothetical protein BC830DRAFT_1152509 [Chytriomyces sp. MP71]
MCQSQLLEISFNLTMATNFMDLLSYFVPAAISLVGDLVTLSLLVYIVRTELPKRQTPVTLRNVFNPTNGSMLTMWISGSGYFAAQSFFNYTQRTSIPCLYLMALFFGAFQIAYVWFSFHRSRKIIKNQLKSSSAFQMLERLVWACPFVYMSPVAVLAISTISSNSISPEQTFREYTISLMFSWTVMCFLDTYFAVVYMRHINTMKDEMKDLDIALGLKPRLIANYGLLATLFTYLCLIAICGCMVYTLNQDFTTVWVILLLVSDVLLLTIEFILLFLKIKLSLISESSGNSGSVANLDSRRPSLIPKGRSSVEGKRSYHNARVSVIGHGRPGRKISGSSSRESPNQTTEGGSIRKSRTESAKNVTHLNDSGAAIAFPGTFKRGRTLSKNPGEEGDTSPGRDSKDVPTVRPAERSGI